MKSKVVFYTPEEKSKIVEMVGMPKKQRSKAMTSFLENSPSRTLKALYSTIYTTKKKMQSGSKTRAVKGTKRGPYNKKSTSTAKIFGQEGIMGFKFEVDYQSLKFTAENGKLYFSGHAKMN